MPKPLIAPNRCSITSAWVARWDRKVTLASAAIRSSANGNQGCIFASSTPNGAYTNINAWGNLFQTNDNWVVELWHCRERLARGAVKCPPIFSTCVHPLRSVGLGNMVRLSRRINGTDRID